MSGVLFTIGTSGIFGGIILILILVAGFAALWLVFGRRKRSEDKAIGILEQMAFFKNMTGSTNNRTR